jgi:hypothetical protein
MPSLLWGMTVWCLSHKRIRAQLIGPSAAPTMAGQARGEGEGMAGPHDKAPPECLFRHRAGVITQV